MSRGGGWLALLPLVAAASLSTAGALPPPGTKAAGCCGVTDPGSDCDTQPKGSWNTTAHGISTLEKCASRCANCSQCSYVSFNPAPDSEDCSWYNEASCNFGQMMKVAGYESEFVQAGRPPPPVTVAVDWEDVTVASTRTAATIEVDVMPFLSRDEWGGPFDGCTGLFMAYRLLPPAAAAATAAAAAAAAARADYQRLSSPLSLLRADYTALSNLGAEFVRFAPWNPDPRAVVLELRPSDCTKDKPSTNFNSTVSDAITR